MQSTENKRRAMVFVWGIVLIIAALEAHGRFIQSYVHYENTHPAPKQVATTSMCDIDAFVYAKVSGVDVWIGRHAVCQTDRTHGVFAWIVDHCRAAPDRRMVLLVDELMPSAKGPPLDGEMPTGSAPLYVRLLRKSPLLASTTRAFVRDTCGGEWSRCALNNLRVERVPFDKGLLGGMDGAKIAVGTWGMLLGGLTDEQTALELDLPVTDTMARFMADVLLVFCGQLHSADQRTVGFMRQAFVDMSLGPRPLSAFADEWRKTGFTPRQTLVAVHSLFAELTRRETTSTKQWLSHAMTTEGAAGYVAAVHNAARLLAPSPRFDADRVVYLSGTLPVFMQGRAFLDLHRAVSSAGTAEEKTELRETFLSTRLEKEPGEEDIDTVNMSSPVLFFDAGTPPCVYVPYAYRLDRYDTMLGELLPALLPESALWPRNWYRSIPVYRQLSDKSTGDRMTITGVKGIYRIGNLFGRTILMFGERHDTSGLLCDRNRGTSMSANEYILNTVMNNPTECYDVMYEYMYMHFTLDPKPNPIHSRFGILNGGGEDANRRYIHLRPGQSLAGTRAFFGALCGADHRRCGLDNLRVHYWDTRVLRSESGRSWKHPYQRLVSTPSGAAAVYERFWETNTQTSQYVALVKHLCGSDVSPGLQATLDELYATKGIDPEQSQVDVFNELFRKRYRKMDARVSLDKMFEKYTSTAIRVNSDTQWLMVDIQLAWTDIYAMTRLFTVFDVGKQPRAPTCAEAHEMRNVFYYGGDQHAKRVFDTLASIALSIQPQPQPPVSVSYKLGNSECTDMFDMQTFDVTTDIFSG